LDLRDVRRYRVNYMYWETRADPGWEEQLYPDAEATDESVEGQTTE